MGAAGRQRPRLARGAARRAGRCRPSTLDCNHIPDAAMTLAVMALYADGTTRLTNIASWRVKETDRIAAMATELRKLGATRRRRRRTSSRSRRPPRWRPAAIHTYDDHRIAMCFSLAAFNPARRCRCASSTRSASPRPSPTTSRRCSAWCARRRRRDPGDHHRRPDRLGQGHAGQRRGAARWATTSSTPARCTAPPRWPRMRAGVAADDEAAPGAHRRDAARCTSPAATPAWAARTSPTRCAPRTSARMASKVSRLAGGARGAARSCSCRSAALPGPGGRRARHGHRDLPRRRPQGLPHRERRRRAPNGAISS